MKTTHYGSLILAAALSVAPCLYAAAADAAAVRAPAGSVERADAKAASALLDRAVDYLKKNGDKRAYAAFNNRHGGFVKGPLYVYVVGLDGMMHANGGAPETLAGTNAMELRDASGKPLIRELLAAATTQDSGQIEYHWLNRFDNQVENKIAKFRKVGDQVVVVGYYIPRATVEQARDMMDKALGEMKKSPAAAYKAFNNPKGKFVHGDLYVFAIGLEDGKFRATGGAPRQSGKDAAGLHDAAGKALVQEMIDLAKSKGSGEVEYVWRNPATNAVETKHTLVERVGDVLLGVGYYVK